MRHSRKAVMAERYKLYMKKNIFNGRYFIRNLQIVFCVVLVAALITGVVILSCSGNDKQTVTASASMGVKEALFGNSEEEKTVAKNNTEEAVIASKDDVVEADAENNAAEEAVTENGETIIEINSTEEFSTEIVSSETVETSEDTGAAEGNEETAEKSEFDGKCIANVDETLNIRKEPGTDSEFVGSMNRGAIAKVESTEGEWTKIKSGDVEGYVLTEYILVGKDAEEFAKDYVTLSGTVLEDGVNVRTEESTDAGILTVLNKDDTITVLEMPENDIVLEEEEQEKSVAEVSGDDIDDKNSLDTTEETTDTTTEVGGETAEQTEQSIEPKASEEEEADKITWLPVMLADGQTGYVSADLVNVESLYEIAVSAEELERKAQEEAAAKKAAEEEAARQAAEAAKQAAAQTSNSSSESNSGTGSSDSYKGATTTPVTATNSGECIGTFTITAYCGCSKCSSGSQKTASGTTPTEGRTIAADTSILPFGTQVVIGGVVYTVEDCGSGVTGNHIDIFFATHSKAIAFGRKTMKVYKY